MKVRVEIHRVFLFSLLLTLFLFAAANHSGAKAGFVGTQTCIDCHSTWQDNNPSIQNIISGNASLGYVPVNLISSQGELPFYTIPEGYVSSIHNTPESNVTATDSVKCEGCHGSGLAHFGVGPIPRPIPDIKTCGTCHTERDEFPLQGFLETQHANPSNEPSKYFDQKKNGTKQAMTSSLTPGAPSGLALFKRGTSGPVGDPVTRNERIQECSVCHNYALNYPQFVEKIAANNMPKKPTVGCGACHDSHIPAPNGNQPAVANGAVQVAALSGSTVIGVTPTEGKEVFYLNHKPYQIGENGAQAADGAWTRGSVIARPQTPIIKGVGTLSSNGAIANRLTYSGGGFLGKVKPHDVLFILDPASATVNLPAAAVNGGQAVTVQATVLAGFDIEEVVDDNTLLIAPRTDAGAVAQLGTNQIAVVAKPVNVTYTRTAGGTANLAVYVPFVGSFNFEVRDMKTNTENLCGSCHTQGKYKFSAWGRSGDGTPVDVSKTHNNDILTQYLTSGHADRSAGAFAEFSAFEYGSSHQVTYPFDMSITGSGGVGSLRNKGNTNYELTQTPNPQNAYLATPGNSAQFTFISNYACNQCHHGFATIDYLNDRQGTSDASVLWGDATVTCWTCHDPHVSKIDANVRIPVKLSYNSRFVSETNPRGGINKFMDGTDIPSAVGNGIICLFCHQGRESGLTVYLNITTNTSVNPYTDPNVRLTGISSFQNPHYLEGGAVLWSKNPWEFIFNGTPQRYTTGNPSHQSQNCAGCHMSEASADNSEGGHTWRPRIEVCQDCHGPIESFHDIGASADYNGNGIVESAFAEIGTINPDSGLFGQLKAALQAKGIYYNPDQNPYFFTSPSFTTTYTAWTTNTLTAAFNLAFMFKSGATVNCIYVHNSKYGAQILIDSLRALEAPPMPWARPEGDRNATDYRTIVINPPS